MTVAELNKLLSSESFSGETGMDREIQGGYVSDLLSDVMGKIKDGYLWITMQSHMNIIAIAALRELPAVLIVNGITPAPEVIKKAKDEGIALLGTPFTAFEAAGIIYNELNR